MTKKQNILLKASIAIAVLFAIAPASNAMHIMDGIPSGNSFALRGESSACRLSSQEFFSILKKHLKTEQ